MLSRFVTSSCCSSSRPSLAASQLRSRVAACDARRGSEGWQAAQWWAAPSLWLFPPSRVVEQPECPSSCSGSNFLGKSNFLGSQEVVTWSTLEYQRNALISRHFWADFMELSAVQFPRKSVPKSVFSQKRRFPQKELDWSLQRSCDRLRPLRTGPRASSPSARNRPCAPRSLRNRPTVWIGALKLIPSELATCARDV